MIYIPCGTLQGFGAAEVKPASKQMAPAITDVDHIFIVSRRRAKKNSECAFMAVRVCVLVASPRKRE